MSDLRGYTEVASDEGLAEAERALRDELGANGHWIDAFRLGLDMETFERSPAGQHIAQRCVDAVNEAFNVFLRSTADQLDSTAVRLAHFDAKVALGMVTLLQDAIQAGRDAEQRIEGRHEPQ